MKKLLSFFFALTMIFPLSACSAAEEPENPSSAPSESSSAISVQETPDGGSSEPEASEAEVSESGESFQTCRFRRVFYLFKYYKFNPIHLKRKR